MNTQTTLASTCLSFDQLARTTWFAMLVGLFFNATQSIASDATNEAASYRKPVAILHLPNTDQLVLATKNDGCFLFYNRSTHKLEQKLPLGGSLESVAPILNGKFLAAVDSVQHLVHIVETPSP